MGQSAVHSRYGITPSEILFQSPTIQYPRHLADLTCGTPACITKESAVRSFHLLVPAQRFCRPPTSPSHSGAPWYWAALSHADKDDPSSRAAKRWNPTRELNSILFLLNPETRTGASMYPRATALHCILRHFTVTSHLSIFNSQYG
jgi:hypothetical protein